MVEGDFIDQVIDFAQHKLGDDIKNILRKYKDINTALETNDAESVRSLLEETTKYLDDIEKRKELLKDMKIWVDGDDENFQNIKDKYDVLKKKIVEKLLTK